MSALRKVGVGIVAAGMLVAGSWYAWQWWTVGRFQQRTDNAYIEADIAVVAPRVVGYIRSLHAVDNQPVRTGDVLVRIEDRELQAILAQARARLAARRAALAALDREAALQRSAIRRAVAELDSAKAGNRRAQLDRTRYAELARRQLVSQQRGEDSEVDSLKARAAFEAASAALAMERNKIDLIEARYAEARAVVAEGRAMVAQAEFDVQAAVIRAPVDGIVANRSARVGQYVRAGTALMVVTPLQSVYVVANFKETQLEHLRAGQEATLWVDAFPGRTLKGIIRSFAPAAGSRFTILPPENATGNFTKIVQRIPVRIELRSDEPFMGRMRPGMSVVATIDAR